YTTLFRSKRRIFLSWRRRRKPAIATDAALVPQGRHKRLTEGDAAILNGMMSVDLKVAFAHQPQIHHRMLRKKGQHVVEKREAGFDGSLSPAVEVETQGNSCFFGLARNACLSRFHYRD